jgi:murein DD-endopeptidase MepM/ murein hydrolase activator NlpD
MKFIILIILFFASNFTFAQDVKLFGEAKQGSLLIGKANNAQDIFLDDKKIQFDENGYFVLGFDRDDLGIYTLVVNFLNGKSHSQKITLKKSKYSVQKLKIASKYVEPPKNVLDRIESERELLKNARKEIGNDIKSYFSSGFTYPVDNVRITGVFGNQRILNGKPQNIHNGIDFGGSESDTVRAISNGIIRFVGNDFYYNGNFVLIDHGQGLTSIYLHLSKTVVQTGAFIKKGTPLGFVGSTGRSTGPHLHLGVQWYQKRIDPLSVIKLKIGN